MYWNYGSLYELHICNMAVKVFILTFSLKRTTSAEHVCIFFYHQNEKKKKREEILGQHPCKGSNQKGKQSCCAELGLIYQGLGECEGQKTEPF